MAARQNRPPFQQQPGPARHFPVPAAQQPRPAPVYQPPAQCYISAFARDFDLAPSGEGTALPLAQQRVSGGFALREGVATVPADGYYMLLWELGVDAATGEAQLHLGVNEGASQLTHALQPGYDAAQQVTWLCAGDKLRLLAKGSGTAKCAAAMLTVIRLG